MLHLIIYLCIFLLAWCSDECWMKFSERTRKSKRAKVFILIANSLQFSSRRIVKSFQFMNNRITYTQMHMKKRNEWERENCKNAFWKQCTKTASTISKFEFFLFVLSIERDLFIVFSFCSDLCCIRFKPTKTQFPFSQRHTKYISCATYATRWTVNTWDFFQRRQKRRKTSHNLLPKRESYYIFMDPILKFMICT